MFKKFDYSIHTDVKFKPLEVIDIGALGDACTDAWYNQSLCRVNDCVVRIGVVEGEFHWHKHDEEDEFFYVVEGKLFIDVEGKLFIDVEGKEAGDKSEAGMSVELRPKQGFTVPKGAKHRIRAPERTVIVMFEGVGVVPTGD